MTEWTQLWNVTLVAPNGLPREFKLRAPSEAILRDKVATYKPFWSIGTDANGIELIRREKTHD